MSDFARKGDPPEMGDPPASDDSAERLVRLENVIELAPVGIGLVDRHRHTTMTNSALRRMIGYSAEEFEAMEWREFTHPEDIEPNEVLFAQLIAGEIDSFSMEKRFLRKTGGYIWAELTVSLVRDGHGNPDYAIGMTVDITERKRLLSDLRAAEERYRLLVERVPAVVYVYEPASAEKWHYVSPQIERMFGVTPQQLMSEPDLWMDHIDPTQRDEVWEARRQMFLTGTEAKLHSVTYRILREDGSAMWVRDDAMVLHDQDGKSTLHGVIVDVTQEKDLEERLGHQALHDPLTGLPNRRLFGARVDQALAGTGARLRGVVVLFIDLDNFKTVNDSWGHASGDEVIVSAARRIAACARADDTAARLGGDEFALLLENVTVAHATALAERILVALHGTPVEFGGRSAVLGASIGIAAAGLGETTETLLRNADLAMYQAKLRGRGRHAVYEQSMHEGAVDQFRLAAALRTAIAAEEITLVYQPMVDLHTGSVVGLEALSRWTDSELGPVPPSDFIPVAEQTGLIRQLGRQVLTRACADVVRWRAQTDSTAYVSVNVSPLQLDDDDFPHFVVSTLRHHGIPASSLVLEVTEGLLLDQRSREMLSELRTHGVRVAIDDFGTGYSSLSYLRELPVDIVKIDQAFIQSVESGVTDLAFMQSIIHLAETLHLVTIAEGIETTAQLGVLRNSTCRYGQGYLLAYPGPIASVPAALPAIRAPQLDHI